MVKKMRKNFGVKSWIYPEPVLMIGTYNDDGSSNIMNAAWGAMSETDEVFISLSEHKTTENFLKRGAFTISIATKKTVVESDYFGVVSGKKEDKVKKANFHPIKSEFVDAPLFEEYPIALECKLKSFSSDGKLIGTIVNVSVDDSVLTDGKVDLDKLEAIAYDPFNNKYVLCKEVVGSAFKDGLKLRGNK